MTKKMLALGCVLLALFTLSVSALASNPGDVAVGGELLFTIRVTVEGRTPAQRAGDVEDRLPEILGFRSIMPADVKVAASGNKNLKITVKNLLLVVVTPADAKVNQVTLRKQAEIWAQRLRKILPLINAKPNPNTVSFKGF